MSKMKSKGETTDGLAMAVLENKSSSGELPQNENGNQNRYPSNELLAKSCTVLFGKA